MDHSNEQLFLGIAHALFMNRLHVLRLTEVVRLNIRPNSEDQIMDIPPNIDEELKEQALNFVLTCFPEPFTALIHQAKADWLRPA